MTYAKPLYSNLCSNFQHLSQHCHVFVQRLTEPRNCWQPAYAVVSVWGGGSLVFQLPWIGLVYRALPPSYKESLSQVLQNEIVSYLPNTRITSIITYMITRWEPSALIRVPQLFLPSKINQETIRSKGLERSCSSYCCSRVSLFLFF